MVSPDTNNSISKTALKGTNLSFTSFEEQQKIGSYFATLDNLIKSQKQKVEQVQTLKKYMLQNIFPKKGETKLNIRFASFTDE